MEKVITVKWIAKNTWKVSAIVEGLLVEKIYCKYTKKAAVESFSLWHLHGNELDKQFRKMFPENR